MKKYINRALLLSASVLLLASCDDNSWNDKLDGFEEGQPSNVQTLNYTLSAADYKIMADNSTNKALAGEDAAALTAVGNNCYFTDVITPEKYIPALLNDPKFQYFTLSNGSSIKVTYNYAAGLPEELTGMANAQKYTISEADYQEVWDSDTDFTNAFTPAKPASRYIPGLLANDVNANEGDFVIVNYQESTQEPEFGTPEPEEPAFELSSALGSISLNAAIDVNGYVAAVSTQGPVIADASGCVFAYLPNNNTSLTVGQQVTFSTTVSSYNYGYQLPRGIDMEVKGSQDVTYPTPKEWTGAEIDAFVAAGIASGAEPIKPVYSKFTGTAVVSGNYINIQLDGTTVQVSPYGANDAVKAAFPNGETVTFEGYVIALASKGKYLNTVITKVGGKDIKALAAASAPLSRAGVEVPSVSKNAIYQLTASGWTLAADTYVLSHSDYQEMGQRYDNLSGDVPATYLPILLKQKYPFATVDQQLFVVYYYYNGSATVTRAEQYTYNGTEWTVNTGIVEQTAQFVKNNGKWNFDPSTVINLPAGKSQPLSTLYFQTCVDWVAANIPGGANYVTSYGNNEYYCGTSAYQGNVDLRPGSAYNQYPEGYEGMTDDEIVALMKKRFETEVFPGALSVLHPDAVPVPGVTVTYTINFYYYTGVTKPATIIYEVTAPATFTFVSCTWNDEQ